MAQHLFGFDTDRQWDHENGFWITSHPTRLPKVLAHYELYKSIVHLPGAVVECGVFKGASFIRFCAFRESLESPYARKLIGFDAFGKFPVQEEQDDKAFIENFERVAGDGIPVNELERTLAYKGYGNYELIQGDVVNTIPEYVATHPELRIALLHIDVDVYKPTVAILDHLYDAVVTGGLIVLDDYGSVAGESNAVDEFCAARKLTVEKSPLSHSPSFIRKS